MKYFLEKWQFLYVFHQMSLSMFSKEEKNEKKMYFFIQKSFYRR